MEEVCKEYNKDTANEIQPKEGCKIHPETDKYNTKRYTGTVECIDPEDAITLRTADGAEHKLPALTTSLVKD